MVDIKPPKVTEQGWWYEGPIAQVQEDYSVVATELWLEVGD